MRKEAKEWIKIAIEDLQSAISLKQNHLYEQFEGNKNEIFEGWME